MVSLKIIRSFPLSILFAICVYVECYILNECIFYVFRKRSDRTGDVGDRLRVCIFHSYSGGGSFCRAGGWRKAFVSAVSDERRHLSGACVFDGASVLECIVCRNRAGFIRGAFCPAALGYTLQVVGQKKVEPTAASLLLSMESVFPCWQAG